MCGGASSGGGARPCWAPQGGGTFAPPPPLSQNRRRVGATAVLDTDEAGIFDAHLMLLEDAELVGAARARIDGGASAAGAWAAAAAALEQQWAALPDPYLRARAADVRAVAGQVLRAL